jgi:cyclase
MLKKRIIPVLLISRNLLIKTKKFISDRTVGNVIQSVKVFNKRESDELTIIDIDASRGIKSIDIGFLKEIIAECAMPISAGGGIETNAEIENLLKIGFDKVVINNGFLKKPDFIEDSVKKFGSSSITIGIDIVKKNHEFELINKYNNKHAKTLSDWIGFAQKKNVGEFFITSVNHEGMMVGYDYELLNYIHPLVNRPILFNGGCKSILDCEKILSYQKVMGACASSIFFFTKLTPASIKSKIKKNINVRL